MPENVPVQTAAPAQKSRSRFWMEILTVVAMPLVTAIVGFSINASLNARQQRENNLRLYADMMTRREQSDSDLRKDMFQSILNKFTSAPGDSKSFAALDQQVVNLELLAYNFHDSIDLGPLFKYVRRQIPSPTTAPPGLIAEYDSLRARLETVSGEVNERQLTVVGDSGVVVRAGVDVSEMPKSAAYLDFHSPFGVKGKAGSTENGIGQVCLTMEPKSAVDKATHYRRFKLEAKEYDAASREILMRMYVSKPVQKDVCQDPEADLKAIVEIDSNFHLGLFDFPMVDNTRLTHNERASVTLTTFGNGTGELALSYFPASRASLKDKPYFDELEHDLKGRDDEH